MKALAYHKYGSPDVLELKEVEKPAPTDNEVLIEIHAASVNYSDWAFVRGRPFLVRLMGAGLLKPKNQILGADIAGRIEGVGQKVKQFKPGDEVYGDISDCGWGGFAEYVAVPENALMLKPDNTSFEEAAAVPQAALVALQGLRDYGKIEPGHRVLINGASGGNGTFAVQIAKSFGAEVTGVCSTRNLDMVRSIGADHVIDYSQEDPTRTGQFYDLILDITAFRPISDYERVLSPEGIYVVAGGSIRRILQASMTGGKKMTNFTARPDQKDLLLIKELIEAGKIVPVIGGCFPLSEGAEAVRHYGEEHGQGKTVISVVPRVPNTFDGDS